MHSLFLLKDLGTEDGSFIYYLLSILFSTATTDCFNNNEGFEELWDGVYLEISSLYLLAFKSAPYGNWLLINIFCIFDE